MNPGRDVRRHVFFASDSTGITVETLVHALPSRFPRLETGGASIEEIASHALLRAGQRRHAH